MNIKAFTDNFTSITSTTSYSKKIEKAFDAYLKRPVEFDIKIDRFKQTNGKDDNPQINNNNTPEEPSSKRVRTEEEFKSLVSYSPKDENNRSRKENLSCEEQSIDSNKTSDASIKKTTKVVETTIQKASYDNSLDYFRLSDSSQRQYQAEKRNDQHENQLKLGDCDNRSFFAQFLSDQTFLSQTHPHSYYSPADFPWLYPAYMYEKYQQAPLPYYYYGEYLSNGKEQGINNLENQNQGRENENNELYNENDSEKVANLKKSLSVASQELLYEARDQKKTLDTNLITLQTTNSEIEIKKEETKEENEDTASSSSILPHEGKKKCKNKKELERVKTTIKDFSTVSRKIKLKDSLKYRPYSLRQRVKALKKAKKMAHLSKPKQPKFILKDIDAKNLTKKEIFLGYLGLRRILKRNDRRGNEDK